MKGLRLKFWYWAHDAAEQLWHWIYYHRIPEGIAQRELTYRAVNHAYYQWQGRYVNSKGDQVDPPKLGMEE